MANISRRTRRLVFDSLALEKYRVSHNLAQREIAEALKIPHNHYRFLVMRSYAPISKMGVFQKLEEVFGLDLGLEITQPYTGAEIAYYIALKHEKSFGAIESSRVKSETVVYPKQCKYCCWRRGAMCLTPLCMKRRHEYDPTMVWGGHLDIVRGNV